jgi:two-component system, sensor histidine kinase FlrB
MPNLPRTRQRTHSPATELKGRASAQENLTRAFLTFTQAAGSLEKSYTQLQGEVARLHRELQCANSELERSLEENAKVRSYLSRVLEDLPCGVLVVATDGTLQTINPEAKRLLRLEPEFTGGNQSAMPQAFAKLIAEAPANSFFCEQECTIPGNNGDRTIGILRANVNEKTNEAGDTIWIVRDLTEQKRLASEREAARRSHALAEVATLLAHEIRNPLGSMELFTGLLADATAQMPETRQWVTHLQAGLRALSATMTNVVDVYINYLRRKVDSGYDRPLIRTIRGVGYQIDGNGTHN